jgi:hypothetical protein
MVSEPPAAGRAFEPEQAPTIERVLQSAGRRHS